MFLTDGNFFFIPYTAAFIEKDMESFIRPEDSAIAGNTSDWGAVGGGVVGLGEDLGTD